MLRRWLAAASLGLAAAWPSCAPAAEAVGLWETPDGRARIRVERCANGLCGEIVWLREPLDEEGRPRRDRNNADESLRERPLVGLSLFSGFRPAGPGRWEDGRIYNPEDGETYRARIEASEPDRLSVSGCVLVFCRTQVWRRAP